ncbi:MAG: hypothetical protein GY822_16780 [Deltaproteobacteria bacterium]|nr:hypothetical protein [Deltaproteobacteria bacterium]
MGLIRRISRVVRRVVRSATGIASGLLKTTLAPLSGVMGMAKGLLGKGLGLLNKLPGGKLLTGFLGKFMSNPMAMMALGPMAMMGMFMGNSFKQNKASETLHHMDRQCGGIKNLPPPAYQNTINITINAHANNICGQY